MIRKCNNNIKLVVNVLALRGDILFDLELWMLGIALMAIAIKFGLVTLAKGANFVIGGKFECIVIGHIYTADKVGIALLVGLVGPVLEEFIFRFPIYWLANGEFSPQIWGLILFLAFVFGVLHLTNSFERDWPPFKLFFNKRGAIMGTLFYIGMGVVYGCLTVVTDSIVPAILVHSTWNFICVIWWYTREDMRVVYRL